MFQRILVPLDGSKRAERAIPVAARIARASGGVVILVRVVKMAAFWPALTLEPLLMQSAMDADHDEATRYLADLATAGELSSIPQDHIVLAGHPVPTLLSVAQSHHADLIVLCSHGYTGLTRWALGSVAEKVARSAPVPVLVLRADGPVPAGPHPDPTRPLRVLVTLDGSVLAKAVLEPAASLIAALAAPAQGALHLVRVVKPVSSESEEKDPDAHEHFLHKAKTYLSTTVEHIHAGLVAPAVADLTLPITWSVAVETDVASAIVRVAEHGEDAEGVGGCDVIAMATHGRSGIRRWELGSITERVLQATRLPLLIVRPPDIADHRQVMWDRATVAAIR